MCFFCDYKSYLFVFSGKTKSIVKYDFEHGCSSIIPPPDGAAVQQMNTELPYCSIFSVLIDTKAVIVTEKVPLYSFLKYFSHFWSRKLCFYPLVADAERLAGGYGGRWPRQSGPAEVRPGAVSHSGVVRTHTGQNLRSCDYAGGVSLHADRWLQVEAFLFPWQQMLHLAVREHIALKVIGWIHVLYVSMLWTFRAFFWFY